MASTLPVRLIICTTTFRRNGRRWWTKRRFSLPTPVCTFWIFPIRWYSRLDMFPQEASKGGGPACWSRPICFKTPRNGELGLQNLGWFQYINDHLTAQTSFDVFTSGTVFNESRLQYRKTGNFNGNIVLGFSSERGLEPTDPGFTETTTRNISITHDHQISPSSNIDAKINMRSADYIMHT